MHSEGFQNSVRVSVSGGGGPSAVEAIIRAEKIEKYYAQPSQNRIQVSSATDLSIVPGEIVALLDTMAAMDDSDSSRDFSLSDYGYGDRVGRCLERFGVCGVCEHSDRPAGSADRHGHRRWELPHSAARDHSRRADGGYDEPSCLEATLSPGVNAV